MRKDWREQAACRGVDASIFHPEAPGGTRSWDEARQYCDACPREIRAACLEEAMTQEAEVSAKFRRYGFRAGLSPVERSRLAAEQSQEGSEAA